MSPLRLYGLAASLVIPGMAWAGFDGSGPPLPVSSDEVAVPLVAWRARRPLQGALSAGFVFEFAEDPLLRQRLDPATLVVEEEGVLAGLAGGRAGVRYAVSDRIELAISAPVWLRIVSDDRSTGTALGDLQVSAPIGLVRDVGPLSVAVVPELSLPTGAQGRYVGDPWPSIGAHGVAELAAGPAVVLGWAGLDVRGFPAEDNFRPGPGLYGGLGAGVALDRRFGLHAAWRGESRLLGDPDAPELAPARVSASSLAVTARGVLFERWYVEGGLGGATHRGPGAATARAWLGLGKSLGGEPPKPLRPMLPLSLSIVDPDGAPVPSADVFVNDELVGQTDPAGRSLIERRWGAEDVVRAEAAGLRSGRLDGPANPELRGEETGTIQLAWAPVEVTARVQDAEGRTLAATVTARGGAGLVQPGLRTRTLELDPGVWTVRAEVDGYGAQERGVVLPPRGGPESLTFILRPSAGDAALELSVVDVDGEPVREAEIGLGGQPIGSTGSGGTLKIFGLPDQPVELDAQADTFRELTRPGVEPGEPVEVVLARERGAVQVVVRGPDGLPVDDAAARFLGADRLGPFQIGERGMRTFVLRPGTWQLLVASERFGLQQRSLDIPERDTALQIVEVVLQPPEEGGTDLTVRVVDPDNQAVPGASIALDGVDYGTTSSGGQLAIDALQEGPRTVAVSGEWLVPSETEVFLAGGLQEMTVVADWKAGTTLMMARGPRGMVPDATARVFGPERLPSLPLGRDGVEYVGLAPGDWQILMSSPNLGLQQLGVAIPEGSRTLHVVEAVLNPGEAGVGRLGLLIVDPDGRPVSGAEVALDEVPLGTTSTSGSVSLVELATGTRRIRVERPPFAPREVDVAVTALEREQIIRMEWGVGAVRIGVQGDGEPASDARIRLGGPRFVPTTPVDGSGTRLLTLEPGSWQLLASSPRYALTQRTFTVPDRPALTQVDVALTPPQAALAELLVRVQDPDGGPVRGASLVLDGGDPVPVVDGLVALAVAPGKHRIAVRAENFQAALFEDVDVREGVTERVFELVYRPRALNVVVRGPDGPVGAARVSLEGPADVAPVQTDARGRATLSLRPGDWTVLASAEGLGVREAGVALEPGSEAKTVEIELQAAQVDVAGGDITIRDTLYFDTGKATLKPASTSTLDEVAATLKAHPELVRLVVEGHTDTTGGVVFNMELSRDRARAVVDALIARGIAPERLDAQGYGPTRPVADNQSEPGRAANRRVELHGETGE